MFGKSKEDKEAERAAKEEAKVQKMLAQYGLQELSDPEDINSVRNIVSELAGTGLMELGATLGGGNNGDLLRIQMYYQRAILEQNFIMIRQLDRISKKLDQK